MTDTRDRDIRELVMRVIAQAPEPAPFPVVAVQRRAPRRRARLAVAVACVIALAVLVAVVAVAHRSSSTTPIHRPTVTTVVPNPLRGVTLPSTGIAIADGDRITFRRDDGSTVGSAPAPMPSSGVTNDPERTGVLVADRGVRMVHEPWPQQRDVPKGCTLTANAPTVRVAVCGTPPGDQVLGDRVEVDDGRGWRQVVASPFPGIGRGHWVWAMASPDGKWVAAQWSGECEVPEGFVVPVAGGSVQPVTGSVAPGGTLPESDAIGWTADSHVLAAFGGGSDCGAGAGVSRGVYAVAPSDSSRRLITRLSTHESALRWTKVDGATTSGGRAPQPDVATTRARVVAQTVPGGCPNLPVTAPPVRDDAYSLATSAAFDYFETYARWRLADMKVAGVYRLGDSLEHFGDALAYGTLEFCGPKVFDNSFGVAFENPKVTNGGSQGDVVVARFTDGWHVWGVYHGPVGSVRTPQTTTSTIMQNEATVVSWIRQYGGHDVPNTFDCQGEVSYIGAREYVANVGMGGQVNVCSRSMLDGSMELRAMSGINAIVGGGDAVFASGGEWAGHAFVERVDPVTLKTMWRRDWPSSYGKAAQVGSNGTLLWVGIGRHLERLDIEKGTIERDITTGAAVAPAIDEVGVHLYTTTAPDNGAATLDLRDPSTGAVIRSATGGFALAAFPPMHATSAGVWVTSTTGSLSSADFHAVPSLQRTATLDAPNETTTLAQTGLPLYVGAGHLWVTGTNRTGAGAFLGCADPETGHWQHVITVPSPIESVVSSAVSKVFVQVQRGVAAFDVSRLCAS